MKFPVVRRDATMIDSSLRSGVLEVRCVAQMVKIDRRWTISANGNMYYAQEVWKLLCIAETMQTWFAGYDYYCFIRELFALPCGQLCLLNQSVGIFWSVQRSKLSISSSLSPKKSFLKQQNHVDTWGQSTILRQRIPVVISIPLIISFWLQKDEPGTACTSMWRHRMDV